MAENEGGGVFSVLKDYFTELFFGDTVTRYDNFSFGNPIVTYRLLIAALALGLIIASALMIYKRRVLGKLARELNRAEVFSPDKAKTLSELGLDRDRATVASLKRGTLRRMIPSVDKDQHREKVQKMIEDSKGKRVKLPELRPCPESDRYYLPTDECKRAALVSVFENKGNDLIGFILTVIFCVAAGAALFAAVPWFIELLDSAL